MKSQSLPEEMHNLIPIKDMSEIKEIINKLICIFIPILREQ